MVAFEFKNVYICWRLVVILMINSHSRSFDMLSWCLQANILTVVFIWFQTYQPFLVHSAGLICFWVPEYKRCCYFSHRSYPSSLRSTLRNSKLCKIVANFKAKLCNIYANLNGKPGKVFAIFNAKLYKICNKFNAKLCLKATINTILCKSLFKKYVWSTVILKKTFGDSTLK